MRVLITGGRDFLDYKYLEGVLDSLDINHIIKGGEYRGRRIIYNIRPT